MTVHAFDAVPALLAEVEVRTHHRLWNLQRSFALSRNRLTWDLDRRSRARRIDERAVVPKRGAAHYPLLTTVEPTIRIGPVVEPLLIADSAFALLSVVARSNGEPWSASTEDPEIVSLAEAAFLETWEQSVAWQEAGLRAPLPDRRFRVAVPVTDGHTDREIADELGISPRTVSDEVRAIVDWLGARSRTHAIAMLVGAA